jgi:hypothetical protein
MNKIKLRKKLSSYQKMKKKYESEIQRLNTDLNILLEDKMKFEITAMRLGWKINKDLFRQLWFGDSNINLE